MVQWLRLCIPNAGVHGFDPWLGKKPYMLATWLGQKFKNFVKSKQKKNDEGMKIMNRILSVVLLEKQHKQSSGIKQSPILENVKNDEHEWSVLWKV